MIEDRTVRQKLWSIAAGYRAESHYFLPIERDTFLTSAQLFAGREMKYYVLELGAGWGEVALQMAAENPDVGFVLMEKNRGRVRYAVSRLQAEKINNVQFIPINFHWFLTELFKPNLFEQVLLNFPDPWPKKKHHKHRTVNSSFLDSLAYLLRPEGKFLFATDYGPYARQVIRLFRGDGRFSYPQQEYTFERHPIPVSAFEKEKQNEGKCIYYLERIVGRLQHD